MKRALLVLAVLAACHKAAPAIAVEPVAFKPPPPPPSLRFASPDATMTIVLDPLPEVGLLSMGAIERNGKPVADLTPATLHLPPSAMHVESGKVRWLGQRAPRLSASGVE